MTHLTGLTKRQARQALDTMEERRVRVAVAQDGGDWAGLWGVADREHLSMSEIDGVRQAEPHCMVRFPSEDEPGFVEVELPKSRLTQLED